MHSRMDKSAVRRIISPARLLFANAVDQDIGMGQLVVATGATPGQLAPIMQMIKQVPCPKYPTHPKYSPCTPTGGCHVQEGAEAAGASVCGGAVCVDEQIQCAPG